MDGAWDVPGHDSLVAYGECWRHGEYCFDYARKTQVECFTCKMSPESGTMKAKTAGGQVYNMCAACFWDSRAIPENEWCPRVDNANWRNKHNEHRERWKAARKQTAKVQQGPPPPPPFLAARFPMPNPPPPSTSSGPATTGELQAWTSPHQGPARASGSASPAPRSSSSDSLLLNQLVYGQGRLLQELKDVKGKLQVLEAHIQATQDAIQTRIDWRAD